MEIAPWCIRPEEQRTEVCEDMTHLQSAIQGKSYKWMQYMSQTVTFAKSNSNVMILIYTTAH